MILKLDTTKPEVCLCLDSFCITFEATDKDRRQNILRRLNKELNACQANIKDIQAIYVNTGPGSFTGTRVGVAIANALALSLGVPLYNFVGKRLQLALPNYSGPAHITTPKKKKILV